MKDFVDLWNQQLENGPMVRTAVDDALSEAGLDAIAAERAANPGLYPPGTAVGHIPDVGWGGNPEGPFAPLNSRVNSYTGGATQWVPLGDAYDSVETF